MHNGRRTKVWVSWPLNQFLKDNNSLKNLWTPFFAGSLPSHCDVFFPLPCYFSLKFCLLPSVGQPSRIWAAGSRTNLPHLVGCSSRLQTHQRGAMFRTKADREIPKVFAFAVRSQTPLPQPRRTPPLPSPSPKPCGASSFELRCNAVPWIILGENVAILVLSMVKGQFSSRIPESPRVSPPRASHPSILFQLYIKYWSKENHKKLKTYHEIIFLNTLT